jgi:hypothetical protein
MSVDFFDPHQNSRLLFSVDAAPLRTTAQTGGAVTTLKPPVRKEIEESSGIGSHRTKKLFK